MTAFKRRGLENSLTPSSHSAPFLDTPVAVKVTSQVAETLDVATTELRGASGRFLLCCAAVLWFLFPRSQPASAPFTPFLPQPRCRRAGQIQPRCLYPWSSAHIIRWPDASR